MVRHADVHNPRNIVYGRLPRFRLSDAGQRQVVKLADALESLEVAAIYSSPRLRARQTARPLADRLGIERVHISHLIDETLTHYQGQSNSVLAGKINFYDNPAHPDDETISMVAERMERFLNQAVRQHEGKVVIAVSHADPIMILRAAGLGLALVIKSIQGRYYPAKCSVMEFAFDQPGSDPFVTYREPVRDETKVRKSRKPMARGDASENGHKR